MSDYNEALRKQVKAMKRKHPHRPAADIARELGISRQRVWQILKELNLPTVTRHG